MTAADFRAIRNALGYTQAALARALGLSRTSIARYEAGATPIPLVVAIAVSTFRPITADPAAKWAARHEVKA